MLDIDQTTDERADERLDREALSAFLNEHGFAGNIEVRQFPAGSSNLTYLICVGEDEFILRRPPFGNTVKTAHDMRREFDVLSKLSKVYDPAPKPLLFSNDESIIGSEFYLMERRHGLVIRGSISQNHLRERVGSSIETRQAMIYAVIKNLADLHSIDYKSAGLEALGKPEGYCRRQVEGWTKRYLAAKTHEHSGLESAIEWLNANIPNETGASTVRTVMPSFIPNFFASGVPEYPAVI